MKTAKRTLAVLLACLMVFGSFGMVSSAKHNAEATIGPIGNNGKINAKGTVTYGLDVYKVTGDSLTPVNDGETLSPGDVIEVQLCFGTDFYAGLISTPIWYDSTYFEPYAEGDVYPYKPGNAFAPDGKPIEEKGDGTDIPYFKLLEENAIPAETANGITATLFDTIAPVDKQGYIGHIGKDAVEGTWKQWTPLTWRTFKNGKQLAGNPVAEEYLKYHLAGIALTMNADGGTGGWDIIVPYAAYFSFQLRVKDGADTNGSADASIFIAMESAKRVTNETCNRLYATECPDGEYTTAQGTATYGQGYDLTNADREFIIGEAQCEHEYGIPTWKWEDDYSKATATFTCSKCQDVKNVEATIVPSETPATCTSNKFVTYTATANLNGLNYTDIKADIEIPNTMGQHKTEGDPVWTWAPDYMSATATFHCTICNTDLVVDADVDKQVVSEASCTANKVMTYSASADFEGNTYTDTKENIQIQDTMLAHVWGSVERIDDNTHGILCSNCNTVKEGSVEEHTYIVDPDIPEVPATEDAPGVRYLLCPACGDQKTEEIPQLPHNHVYGEPTWTWNADYSEATATFQCTKCEDTQVFTTTVIDIEYVDEPVCGVDRTVQYKATLNFNGAEYEGISDQVTLAGSAPAHEYGQPTWIWAADYSTATATFTCANCNDTQNVEATVTPTTVSELSCTTDKVVTYNAVANFNGTDYNDTKENVIVEPATGHTYSSVWNWAPDYKSATVTLSCDNCEFEDTFSAESIDETVVTVQGCETDEVVNYTATLTYDGTPFTDTKEGIVTKTRTGHAYAVSGDGWDWAVDYKSATVTLICANCQDEQTLTDNETTETVQTPAGCLTDKEVYYTASVEFDGKTFSEDSTIVTIENSALGHDWPATWMYVDENLHQHKCTRCEATETESHNYVKNDAESTPATTTSVGEDVFYCDGCGHRKTVEVPMLDHEHEFTNYVSNNDATCTEDGTKTAKCNRCDATDTITDVGSKLGHSFTNYVSNNDATCTADGTKTAKCDRCDVTDTITDEGSKLGHSFTNYVSNNDATCTADGTKTAKCDRCDATDTITDEGSKLGHSFTNYVSNNDATCTADGTKTAKCDRCDVTDTITDEGSKLGHSFTNYVSNNDATCTADGTKTAKCDRCDVTDTIADEGSKLGHSFTNYVSNNDATCTADGTKTAKCDRCDATDTIADEGSALGHSFTNYVSNNDATCTADGTKTAKCDRCDATDTIADEGSKLAHTPAAAVEENKVDATCKQTGSYDEVIYCSVCHTELSRESKTIELKAHTPGAPVEENRVEPTTTSTGSYDSVVYCTVCGAEISRETKTIDKLPEDPELLLTPTAPDGTPIGETGNAISVEVPYTRKSATIFKLTSNIEGTKYSVDSKGSKYVTVDDEGNVKLTRLCLFGRTATITATAPNGKTATSAVKVTLKWWQILIWFLFGWLWY